MENTQFCWHYALQNRSRLILIDHQFSSQSFKNANLIERLVSTIVQYHRQKKKIRGGCGKRNFSKREA
jgi:hypothetical protein